MFTFAHFWFLSTSILYTFDPIATHYVKAKNSFDGLSFHIPWNTFKTQLEFYFCLLTKSRISFFLPPKFQQIKNLLRAINEFSMRWSTKCRSTPRRSDFMPVLLPIATFAGRDFAGFADRNSAGRDICRLHLPVAKHLAGFTGREFAGRDLPVATFAGRDICRSGTNYIELKPVRGRNLKTRKKS